MWSKVDDQAHSHPKLLMAWHASRPSLGLHLLALSYAGAHLTDGHVSEAFVRTHLPAAAERRRAVSALVDAGLWEHDEQGWQIHDFLDYNPSREKVLRERQERAEQRSVAGRSGAVRRWSGRSTTNGKQSENGCSPYGEQMAPAVDGKRMPPTRPVPTRTRPVPDPLAS